MKKKGFTLIELLVVIVILAVIALIVTPIVTGIIAQAKISANARSVEGHIKDVQYIILEISFKGTGNINKYDGTYPINNVNLIDKLESDGYRIQASDKIECSTYTVANGTVTEATGCTETGWGKTYNYTSTGGAVVVGENSQGATEDAYTMAAMCPGCVFGKYWSTEENEYDSEHLGEEPKGTYTNSYTEYGNNFLGFVIDEYEGSQIISRGFVCGKENNKYFCLEYAEDVFDKNIDILLHFFDGCPTPADDAGYVECGVNDYAYTFADKDIGIGNCYISSGAASCY